MLNKMSLAGLACALLLSAPAFGSVFGIPWAPNNNFGGAIGGTAILGTTKYDNAPLSAIGIDRYAHVTGNYQLAIAKFDRVIRPDGSVVLMRRILSQRNPDAYSYLPNSWPQVAALGKERIMDASGRMVAEREVLIPQFQIMRSGIPTDGPQIATLSFERTIMPDGSTFVTASAESPEPGVAIALLGNEPAILHEGIPTLGTRSVAVASQ